MSTQISNDLSWHRFDRTTASGRKILYDIVVLQQPQHARACGSGPKSSADRRPVDPPPIVRLNIFEGESWDNCKDITFDYNADFFLYVSLENARPMAHGRVQTPAATSPPVLTGSPVSSCCFLDRPDPAGYFLFPDLSVRHEGRYKLVFNLFEQIKDPADVDAVPKSTDGSDAWQSDDRESYQHRATICSKPFTVFSAKKFPGLSQSTDLSRTIAEQGCRVRIRRDVRMRRRETKVGNNGDFEKREEEYMKQHRTQSPADAYRARSASNSSLDRAPYNSGIQRRLSGIEYPPPPPPAPSQVGSGALQFGQGAPGYKLPAPPTAASTPASPVHPSFGSYTYAPPPVHSPYVPQFSSRPISSHEEGKRFTMQSFGNPPLLPRPSPPSRPSIDTSMTTGPPLLPGSSPLTSPRHSLSSTLSPSFPRLGKRTHDDKSSIGDSSTQVSYSRASGKNKTFNLPSLSTMMSYRGGFHSPVLMKPSYAIEPAYSASSVHSDDEHDYLADGLYAASMTATDAVEHARKRRFR